MKYLVEVLRAFDQTGNALIGGNPDVTISSHVGGMADTYPRWNKLKKIIDYTFAPIEKNHCENSFLSDTDSDFTDNFYLTGLVVTVFCALLFIPIRILGLWHSSK